MLDAGFENDIRRIVAHCPGSDAGRQTVMCEFKGSLLFCMLTSQSPPLGPSLFVVSLAPSLSTRSKSASVATS